MVPAGSPARAASKGARRKAQGGAWLRMAAYGCVWLHGSSRGLCLDRWTRWTFWTGSESVQRVQRLVQGGFTATRLRHVAALGSAGLPALRWEGLSFHKRPSSTRAPRCKGTFPNCSSRSAGSKAPPARLGKSKLRLFRLRACDGCLQFFFASIKPTSTG